MNRADNPMLLLYDDAIPACSVCAFYSVNIGIAKHRADLVGPRNECEECNSKELRLTYGA